MNYKLKYIKYKTKYLEFKMNHFNLIGGYTIFTTKNNNGQDNSGIYSNQCMWISIIDFLNGVLNNNVNLEYIRKLGSSDGRKINNSNEPFDTDEHLNSLLYVAQKFDLQIHMYIAFRNGDETIVISEEPNWIIGNSSASNVVSIVSYGAHFELITKINERKLYGGRLSASKSNYSTFIPNRDLAFGKEIKTISKEELREIDNLLELSIDLNRAIANAKQTIDINTTELKDLKIRFSSDRKKIESLDEQEQIAYIVSYQERELDLIAAIETGKKYLDEMKMSHDEVQNELNKQIK